MLKNTPRPIEILYVNADGLAIGEIEGSPRQLEKEKSSDWTRLYKTLDERIALWKEHIEGVVSPHRNIKRPSMDGKRPTVNKKDKLFIIGGGTTAQQIIDDRVLFDYIHDYTVMACNKSAEKVNCDYLVYYDLDFPEKCPGLFIDPKYKIYAKIPSKQNLGLSRKDVTYVTQNSNISFNLEDGLYMGNNCGVFSLALSVALGFKEIYLIGIDGRFNMSRTESHFHGGYGNDISDRAYDSFSHYFEQTGRCIKEQHPDVKLFNCSYISLMDCKQEYFKRIDLTELL